MSPAARLILAIIVGFTGLASVFLIVTANVIPHQDAWLLASVSLLAAATLLGAVADIYVGGRKPDAEEGPAPPSAIDREVHGEVAKVVGLLQSQLDANVNFTAALDKAKAQLPDAMRPEQVRLVVSYLMIENENMRARTAELQGNLEKSQRQIERLKSHLAAAEAQGLSDPLTASRTAAASISRWRPKSPPPALAVSPCHW